jgi:integrase
VQRRMAVIEKHTKSGTPPRVALDAHALSLLAEHRDRVVGRCRTLGCELSLEGCVFSLPPDGSTPYKPRSVSQRYRRACDGTTVAQQTVPRATALLGN